MIERKRERDRVWKRLRLKIIELKRKLYLSMKIGYPLQFVSIMVNHAIKKLTISLIVENLKWEIVADCKCLYNFPFLKSKDVACFDRIT